MMLTIEKLKIFGADTEDGLKRCMNMEDFYLGLVQSVLDDTKLTELQKAIDDGNLDTAFELAHALKGVYANLSLTPLYEPVSQMTELLRNRAQADYSPFLEQARSQMKILTEISQ